MELSLPLRRAEEGFPAAAAEQEGEPVQVLAQLAGLVSGMADEVFWRRAEAPRSPCSLSARNCSISASSAASLALRVLLSLASFGIALISDSLWAVAAGTVRSWFAGNPRRLAAVGGVGGLAMIGVGVSVAVTGRRS